MLKQMLLQLKGDLSLIHSEYFSILYEYDLSEVEYTIKLVDMIILDDSYVYTKAVQEQLSTVSDYMDSYFESGLNTRVKKLAENFNMLYNSYIATSDGFNGS